MQNSLDSVLDSSKPVRIEFSFSNLNARSFSNFFDLQHHFQDSSIHSEELKIELHTQTTDDEQAANVIDFFQDLQEDLAPRGIDFSWYFDAIHDRSIVLDNGWIINLGRGLDIYERYSRFSLCATRPENRSCKEFSISIVQD